MENGPVIVYVALTLALVGVPAIAYVIGWWLMFRAAVRACGDRVMSVVETRALLGSSRPSRIWSERRLHNRRDLRIPLHGCVLRLFGLPSAIQIAVVAKG